MGGRNKLLFEPKNLIEYSSSLDENSVFAVFLQEFLNCFRVRISVLMK